MINQTQPDATLLSSSHLLSLQMVSELRRQLQSPGSRFLQLLVLAAASAAIPETPEPGEMVDDSESLLARVALPSTPEWEASRGRLNLVAEAIAEARKGGSGDPFVAGGGGDPEEGAADDDQEMLPSPSLRAVPWRGSWRQRHAEPGDGGSLTDDGAGGAGTEPRGAALVWDILRDEHAGSAVIQCLSNITKRLASHISGAFFHHEVRPF